MMNDIYEGTATGTLFTGQGSATAFILTAGAENSSVIFYDNTTASGRVLLTLKAAANTTKEVIVPGGTYFRTGIHAVISGTGAKAYVAVK